LIPECDYKNLNSFYREHWAPKLLVPPKIDVLKIFEILLFPQLPKNSQDIISS
jgi:hypothetical protein